MGSQRSNQLLRKYDWSPRDCPQARIEADVTVAPWGLRAGSCEKPFGLVVLLGLPNTGRPLRTTEGTVETMVVVQTSQ